MLVKGNPIFKYKGMDNVKVKKVVQIYQRNTDQMNTKLDISTPSQTAKRNLACCTVLKNVK